MENMESINNMDNLNHDSLLEYLVVASETGFTSGVTLLVNGDCISGTIISFNEYCELVNNINDDLAKVLRPFMDMVMDGLENIEEETFVRNYIHLKDAEYISKNIKLGDIPVRIKISDVAGFNFGTMTYKQ